jgi:hypothetical protein
MIATSVHRLTNSDSAAHWATVADDHYSNDSTLGAIEDQFGLGTLGQSNQKASRQRPREIVRAGSGLSFGNPAPAQIRYFGVESPNSDSRRGHVTR